MTCLWLGSWGSGDFAAPGPVTADQAYRALRSRLEERKPADLLALRFQNEAADSNGVAPLPDRPEAFAYVEFLTQGSAIAGYGGGRGNNLYRNQAKLHIYVFVPNGSGASTATTLAEECAVLFRSYRDQYVSCFAASVITGGSGAEMTPPGLRSEGGNYWWALVEVELFFDQIG